MGRLVRTRHALRMFTPEQWRTLQQLARMVKAHPQAEADMRRFSDAAFQRNLLPADLETFPVVSWDQAGME